MIWLWIVLGVMLIVGVIGFTLWFCNRTPDNLEGYYNTPVITFSVFVGVIIVIAVVLLCVL